MTTYYLDTSALAKRYLAEVGSAWMRALTDPAAGNVTVICDLTPIEFFSLLARRQREGTVTSANALILQNRFLADYAREYLSVPLENAVLSHARNLVAHYTLRSLDSIQLASAIAATNILGEATTFISADNNLLVAVTGEGFKTDNPITHP